MRTNVATKFTETTHEGARAARMTPEQALRRSVMACMLWEDEFYEDGVTIAERIPALVAALPFEKVAPIVIEAREKMKLRHVPLWITVALLKAKHQGRKVGDLIARVCQRADEPAELLSMYWKGQPQAPLPKQLKLGLARALAKFDEHQLAKYNRAGAVKLRDVLFLSHAKPNSEERAALYKRIAENTLATPDTWEVKLSGGADKKETFLRLMAEGNLGGLAFLRNLRNMKEAGVQKATITDYMQQADFRRVLPFRFVAAAAAVPGWEDAIDEGFLRCTQQAQKLPGKTVLIVDVSGSMYGGGNVSARSDMTRAHVAGALAAIGRVICEDAVLYATAGSDAARIHATEEVPPRKGMALVALFTDSGSLCLKLGGGGIFLTQCMDFVAKAEKTADRVIVLTDEQDCDHKLTPEKANAFGKHNYLINVASARNGIGYGRWTHIDGWSEAVIDYIRESERTEAQ